MDNSEGKIRRREFKIVPRHLHPEQDCRLRDFAVLSTFNESPSHDGRPALLIPGKPPSLIKDEQPKTIPITVLNKPYDHEQDPTILNLADMPPNSFDNLLRSLPNHYLPALAASRKTVITDAATLDYLFRLVSMPAHHWRADVWVNMQAVGDVLFLRAADPSADKVPRVRAAERALTEVWGVPAAAPNRGEIGRYKRVVRWRMADLELVVKDASLVAVSCAEEEKKGGARDEVEDQGQEKDGCDLAKAMPIAELSLETKEQEKVQHLRVVGNIGALSQCDAGFYFSGCGSAQSFWVQTADDGQVEVAGPKQRNLKPKVGLWEEKNTEILRALAHFLDKARELVCKETRRTPGAKFAGNWRTSFSFFKIWYAAPDVDGHIVKFSQCPYLVSEDVRRRLEEMLEQMAPRQRNPGNAWLEAAMRRNSTAE